MTVFLCVLGGLILLLCLPVSVWVGLGDTTELAVGWLGFKLKLEKGEKTAAQKEKLEKKKAKKAAKEAKKAEKAKKKGGNKKPAVKEPKSLDDLTDTLGLIMDFVSKATGGVVKILKNLRVRDFNLKITVAKYDAAETAIEYGKTSAYVYGVLAALQNYIKITNMKVEIKPDFLVDKGSFSLSLRVLFTPLIVLAALTAMLFGALCAFLKRELAKQSDKPPQNKPEKAVK